MPGPGRVPGEERGTESPSDVCRQFSRIRYVVLPATICKCASPHAVANAQEMLQKFKWVPLSPCMDNSKFGQFKHILIVPTKKDPPVYICACRASEA